MYRKNLFSLLAFVVIAVMLLTACQPQTVEVVKTVVVEKEGQQVVVTATPAPVEKKPLPDKIVVGVVQPLTGTFAVFGQESKIGAELAIKHINEAGGIKSLGGIQLEMVVEDAGDNPDSSKLATESIISKHRPVAILGMYISRFVMASS
jgi:ABC-type branched-subunit amino acid transport system substrate-binding protein